MLPCDSRCAASTCAGRAGVGKGAAGEGAATGVRDLRLADKDQRADWREAMRRPAVASVLVWCVVGWVLAASSPIPARGDVHAQKGDWLIVDEYERDRPQAEEELVGQEGADAAATSGDPRDMHATHRWTIECVDCPEYFWYMSDRSLRLDADGHPHIIYGGDHLYHAWHDGSVWHREIADESPGVGRHASMDLDRHGRPHVAYVDAPSGLLKYAWRDASQWHVETVDTGLHLYRADTSLGLDANGDAHIMYRRYDSKDLRYAVKDGDAWRIEIVDGDEDVGRDNSVALDDAGYLHVVYYDDTVESLKYAFRDSAGWHIATIETELGYWGGRSSLALDSGGHPHVSYADDSYPSSVKYAWHDGSGWHSETVESGLEWTGNDGEATSLALDESDRPHISFSHDSYVDGWEYQLRYAHRDAGGVWRVNTLESEGYVGACNSLALNGSGFPHISYYRSHEGASELRYIYRDGSGWNIQPVNSSGAVGEHSSLALDRDGHAHISYFGDSALKYASEDATGWHFSIADPEPDTGWVGQDGSLELDRNGFAHVSYLAAYPHYDLRYAFQDATGWHIETVDSEGQVGYDTSLSLDGEGRAHISYRDWDHNDLKYAYRDAEGWHVETVDSEGSVGYWSSLELDGSGLAHISYSDRGNGDLKYAYQDALGWHVEIVDSKGDSELSTGWSTSLELDGTGRPHIGYYGSLALKYSYKDDTGWHTEVADDSVFVEDVSLVLDGQGDPHIGYWGGGGLHYAYQDGSGWHVDRVVAKAGTGSHWYYDGSLSLALDQHGNAHISYYHGDNLDLMYAKAVKGWSLYLPEVLRGG